MNVSFTTTGVNFANINLLIPKEPLTDICQSYRKYRAEKMRAGLSLDTLAPQKPLKAATIKAKMTAHKVKRPGTGSFKASKVLNPTQRALMSRKLLTSAGARKIQGGYVSATPTTPLVDTANMADGTMFNVRDGYAEIFQGKSRAKIVEYHQFGEGNNPVRVSLAFNQDFVSRFAVPLLQIWLEKAVANA